MPERPIMLSDHITPEPNPPLTLARVIRARELYGAGFTVSRIMALCQVSLGTLYACLDGSPFADQGAALAPIPRRRQVLGKRRRALKTDSASLVNRLTRTAERQVRDIETRLSAREQPPVERERDVRMLAQLTRALRDLQALQKGLPAPQPADDEDPAYLPEDIDRIRRELAYNMEAMAAGSPPEPDASPDVWRLAHDRAFREDKA